MGLSGTSLQMVQLLLVVLPAFVLFGYNQSGVGGLLSLRDWNDHFPDIDVIDAHGAEKSHKSTVQGAVVSARLWQKATFYPKLTLSGCYLHHRCSLWCPQLHVDWRPPRSSQAHLWRCLPDPYRRDPSMHCIPDCAVRRRSLHSRMGYRNPQCDSPCLAVRVFVVCQPRQARRSRWMLHQSGLPARGVD
jgi:hypothetical protein